MSMTAVFDRRVRGFRVVDVGALTLLVTLVLGVYAFKASAGREGAQIVEVDRQIADERRAVRLLSAELAHLEQPARLERLSTAYLGLAPAQAKREAPVDSLAELAHQAPAAAPVAPPAPIEAGR